MADKPTSPFARLDTSLLRSTKEPTPAPSTVAPAPEHSSTGRPTPSAPPSAEAPAAVLTGRSRPPAAATPPHHDTTLPDQHVLEEIRRAVKRLGKEAATYRFTDAEKKSLSSIVFAYKGQGVRTSENEITRIAINYIVGEYQRHGRNSILARVLAMLNA